MGPGKAEGGPHNAAGKLLVEKMKSPPGISALDYRRETLTIPRRPDANQPFVFGTVA